LTVCPGTRGIVMQQARVVGRIQPGRPVWLAIGLAVLASGCVSTSALRYGGGFALTQAECNQTDSTVTCCLKQNPGQYERCGATPPTEATRPNNLLPGRTESEAAPIPELPTQEEKERWDRDICRPHYAKCIRAGGDSIPGRKAGETQCQACYDACIRHGFWPWKANDKPCPGA
jgi:hypothetical protein